MAAVIFRYQHRVTYAECTLGNHVYYARYLDLLEAARGAFFRELGGSLLQWQEGGRIFPVLECRLRYKSPARYDDVLAIEVWPTAIERVRLNFAHRVVSQTDELILEAETFHVCAALDEKPKRLPAELAERLGLICARPRQVLNNRVPELCQSKSVSADSAAGQICTRCGLCCNGVLFKDVELQPGDDATKLKAIGLPVSNPRSASGIPKFPQPCAALNGCLCRIYPDRPKRCRDFECALLKSVQSGEVPIEAALCTIRAARKRADKVLSLLRELGDADEQLALSLRFKRTKKRFERAPADDDVAETFSRLTLAVHDLNLLLRDRFYPG